MDNLERGGGCMEKLNEIVSAVDGFVWGPVMLVLLVGTGIFLTIRTGFLPWRNLGYALKSTLSKQDKEQGNRRRVTIFGTDHRACCNHRNGKYRWCCNGHGIGRSRSTGVDVDIRSIWNDIQVLRVYACYQVP